MTNKINATIITIGDELLIGQTIDTNSAFIARVLNKAGIGVQYRIAVGDIWEDIWNTLDDALNNNNLVIITGGLGPTNDDITKKLLCSYFNSTLVIDAAVLEHITNIFTIRNRPEMALLERNIQQAAVPDNCTVIKNEMGTAPGMWFDTTNNKGEPAVVVALPGVPFEMIHIFNNELLPKIVASFKLNSYLHRTLLLAGAGESQIAEHLVPFEAALPATMKLAYLPESGLIKLRLSGTPNTIEENAEYENQYISLKQYVSEWLISDENEKIENVIATLLLSKKLTMGTAESCTGGKIAHLLTLIPGSSEWYKGSVISYANSVKNHLLHVPETILAEHGAVSEATAIAMAKGAVAALDTDVAIAVTGIAGPGGGSTQKPVGTVWMAAAGKNNVITRLIHMRYDRATNINNTATQALLLLRSFITTAQTY